jgi:mono/diheme cytochrome c family protein
MTARRLVVTVVLVLCAVAVAGAAAATKPKPKPLSASGNPGVGKHLFQQQQCGSCHIMAAAGEMDGSGVGPDLDHVTKTYAQIVTQITSGGHGMTPYKGVLSAAQIQDVATFIWQTSHPK